MGFQQKHSITLERPFFSIAQGYAELWPQMAKLFPHLVRLIKPICILQVLEESGGMDLEELQAHVWVCVGVSVKPTISLKAPLGCYDPYCELSTKTLWKKTHTHAYRFRSTHTHILIHHVPQSKLWVKSNRTVLMLQIPPGVSKKKLVFVFFWNNPQHHPHRVPFALCCPEGLAAFLSVFQRLWLLC